MPVVHLYARHPWLRFVSPPRCPDRSLHFPLPALQAKSKDGIASRLLFKKRMFRETDEAITEPQFTNLSYIQAQHDFLQARCARCC